MIYYDIVENDNKDERNGLNELMCNDILYIIKNTWHEYTMEFPLVVWVIIKSPREPTQFCKPMEFLSSYLNINDFIVRRNRGYLKFFFSFLACEKFSLIC